MKIAAVVVLYNPNQDNIDNINRYLNIIDKIYVVDNSEDNIIRISDSEKIKYIKYGENKGMAKALNEGSINAINDGYKWLLTMDQDSKITEENIKDMLDYLDKNQDDKKIGLISPYHDIGKDELPPEVEVEDMIEVMTSGNIINLDAYNKIGGFKDWLFIDCVDTDYCMNLHKNDYKVLRLNKIIMKHYVGNITFHKLFNKVYDCSNHNPIRRYYIMRNNLYICDMYKDAYPEYCKRLIRIQKGQIKRILIFEKNKIKKIKMVIKGYKDHKKGIRGKLKNRG